MKIIVLVLLLPILTLQWWDVGHMLTAAIAEIRLLQLNPYALSRFKDIITSINSLVDDRSQTFIQSSCWPDDIKGNKYSMLLWNDWHFLDKPYVSDGVFPVINMTGLEQSSVSIVQNAIKVLSTDINKTTSEKALFARYLVHLVGDIHQPLHSVSLYNTTFPSGDRGGNSLKIIILNGTSQNLHSYWDAGAFLIQNDSWFIVRPMGVQNITVLKNVASDYINSYGKAIEKLAQNLNPNEWALESYRYAQNTTYPLLATTNKITKQYSDNAYQTSKRRITLAGYRLANLVIKIYDLTNNNQNQEQILIVTEQPQQHKDRIQQMSL